MKRTEITGSDVNAGGFDGTEGKKRLAEQLSNKRSALSYKQKLNEIIPCPRNITEHFTTGWITSLLGHSLFYVLGHSWINLHYTLQAGCLPHLPLPPFILVHLQKLLGVAGERAEQSGSGFWWFIQLGEEGGCSIFFLLKGTALYTSVYLRGNV